MIRFKKLHTPREVVEECVVVIDVIRAFTTAAFAFAHGAEKIIPVSTIEQALTLKNNHPEFLLMGEAQGLPINGFDFGNSPLQFEKKELRGKTIVQRTSAGTQGISRSIKSKNIFAASFVVAQATLNRLRILSPSCITFVITGSKNGDEDCALADYLEESLLKGEADPTPYLTRVIASPEGQVLLSPHFPKEELDAVLQLNAFPFCMEIFMDDDFPILYPISTNGKITSQNLC